MKTIPLPDKIGRFNKYVKKPNAISCGTVFTTTVHVDVPYEQKRTLRVYLPEDYDGKKRFPVLYMCDAQNMVDRYVTAYGEWDIDDHMHALLKEGKQSFIVAGIDCPKVVINRIKEYALSGCHSRYRNMGTGYGKQYADFIINVAKPLIDKTFKTLPDQPNTGFGGSSMGGICAFDMVSLYPGVFSFALAFSPAFYVMNAKEYWTNIKERKFYPNEQKYYFFTGKRDLDAKIYPGTVKMFKHLRKIGFDENHVALLVDTDAGHCEASWSTYFKNAIRFWQK